LAIVQLHTQNGNDEAKRVSKNEEPFWTRIKRSSENWRKDLRSRYGKEIQAKGTGLMNRKCQLDGKRTLHVSEMLQHNIKAQYQD